MNKDLLMAKTNAIKSEMDANAATAALVTAAGGIRTTTTQSDKLGFDFTNYYVNDVLVRQDYTAQETARGTAENPIPWTAEELLYPNFYYIHEDVRKVWTGESGVTAGWGDEKWVEF